MSRTKGELHVDTPQVPGQPAVLVLGIDDVHLDPSAKSAQRECRKQIGLARAGMSEHADVRIGVAPLVEGVEEHGRSGRDVSSNDQTAGLLKVGLEPGKEGDQRARIEDALAPKALDAQWLRREVAVEHSQGAGL